MEVFPTSAGVYGVLQQGHKLGAARLCASRELWCLGKQDSGGQSTTWAAAQNHGIVSAPTAGSGEAGTLGNWEKAQVDMSVMSGWGGWVAAE